ncbi:MAG TPA: right-handed parallel beta-helix repeat-containing protein, partial [Ilumatobacteraceae bacterium]|nr:right-handed parallel beta-helix repeat-containing protein [Ilumatobacteraceae bacterium]
GAELHQVASESAVQPGTFYADYAGNRLVIGSNPVGHEVRGSDLAQAVKVSTSNVTLRGFGVRRYATSLPLIGTVRIDGNNNVLRDLVITDNATQGLSFRQSGNLVDHLAVTYNGMTGIHANVADGLTIRNSVVDHNNAQQFNAAPSAAGAKITRSRHLTITNDSFDDNAAAGLWFDQCDVYFTVANNSFQGDYIAVQLEMADTGIVANNVFRSGKYGLYVFDTGNVGVCNNSFADHSVGAVLMSQDQRRQSDPTAYQRDGDSRYPPGDATNPWLLRNVVVANNMFISDSTAGMFQVYALDKRTNIPADAMNLTISGNYFRHRDTSAQPSMVGWGGSDNVTVTRYESPDALSTAKNGKWRNAQAPTGMQAAARITVDQSIASPLPGDVAAAVGQPAGTQHIGTF